MMNPFSISSGPGEGPGLVEAGWVSQTVATES